MLVGKNDSLIWGHREKERCEDLKKEMTFRLLEVGVRICQYFRNLISEIHILKVLMLIVLTMTPRRYDEDPDDNVQEARATLKLWSYIRFSSQDSSSLIGCSAVICQIKRASAK
jgi:hypothetical protein